MCFNGCLDQYLAAAAHPLAADVALDGEHARLVVQLLGHVFAHALHGLAAAAVGGFGLVVHIAARQVRGQRLALRKLLAVAVLRARLHLLDLGRHCRQVSVQRLVEQALLLGVERLRLGSEFQSLEDGVLVRELVDDGLLEGDGLLRTAQGLMRTAQGLMRTAQGLAQPLFIKGVEVVGDHGE